MHDPWSIIYVCSSLHDLGLRIQDLGFRIQDLGSSTQNAESRIHKPGARIHSSPFKLSKVFGDNVSSPSMLAELLRETTTCCRRQALLHHAAAHFSREDLKWGIYQLHHRWTSERKCSLSKTSPHQIPQVTWLVAM